MNRNKILLLQTVVAAIPLVYVVFLWQGLPERLPMHYDINWQVDSYGSKMEFFMVILLMFGTTLFTSAVILYANKLDPKKKLDANNPLIVKISWTITVLITLLSLVIAYITTHFGQFDFTASVFPKLVPALVCLLFIVLGNLMNNVKPNYFIGIRVPWTLENPDNWRLTHHLAAKLWFFGGMVLLLAILLFPARFSIYILLPGLLLVSIIPIVYSFVLFQKNRRKLP